MNYVVNAIVPQLRESKFVVFVHGEFVHGEQNSFNINNGMIYNHGNKHVNIMVL